MTIDTKEAYESGIPLWKEIQVGKFESKEVAHKKEQAELDAFEQNMLGEISEIQKKQGIRRMEEKKITFFLATAGSGMRIVGMKTYDVNEKMRKILMIELANGESDTASITEERLIDVGNTMMTN